MLVRFLIFAVLAAASAGVAVFSARIPNFPPAAIMPVALVAAVLAAIVLLNLILHAIPKRVARAFELLITAAILIVVVGGIAYVQFIFKPGFIKAMIAKAPPPVATVMVQLAKTETWTPKLSTIGTFRASEGIDVAPQVGGWVTARRFDSGDKVKAGDLLLEIDTSTEQADLKNGNAQLKNTEVALDRQRQLLSSSNTSKSAYDSALAARDSAAATVERYKAVIALKKIRAPFSGRLGIRKVDIGQYVSPGMALVSLQKVTPIYLDFSLPEQNLAVLRKDQPVEITVDPYPGKIFKGKIQTIDARVNQETRNVLVRALVDNQDEALLPGMFANVYVIAGAPRAVVTVPRTAITYSLYGDSVYVVKSQPPRKPQEGDKTATAASPAPKPAVPPPVEAKPKAGGPATAAPGAAASTTKPADAAKPTEEPPMIVERRFVRVGESKPEVVAINEGLKAGDVVVTAGQIKLQPNSHVRIDKNAVLKPPAVRPRA